MSLETFKSLQGTSPSVYGITYLTEETVYTEESIISIS